MTVLEPGRRRRRGGDLVPLGAAVVIGILVGLAIAAAVARADPFPTVPVRTTTDASTCGPYRDACAWPAVDGGPPWVAIASSDRNGWTEDLPHELGHASDYVAMSDAARAAFQTIIRRGGPWRNPPNSPHEAFAEGYGFCFRGILDPARDAPDGVGYGYPGGRRTQRRVCALIRRQAARARAEGRPVSG